MTHNVTKNVGVCKAHGPLFMGDNFKTTLKAGKIVVNIRIFNER